MTGGVSAEGRWGWCGDPDGSVGVWGEEAGRPGLCRPTGFAEGGLRHGGRSLGQAGEQAGGGQREAAQLTVGAASSSISPQVEALFPSRSEMTPARIPPARQRVVLRAASQAKAHGEEAGYTYSHSPKSPFTSLLAGSRLSDA